MRRILILCLALSGCAAQPVHWYRADTTQDTFAHDRLQCAQYALQKQQVVYGNNPFGALSNAADATECLRSLGYRQVKE